MRKLYTLFLISCTFAIANAQIYVDQSATGAGNGNSWTDAYTELHEAITNSAQSDEIWVAAGTYLPTTADSNRSISFYPKNGQTIYGGFDGTEATAGERDPSANVTILSGDLEQNDNSSLEYTDATRQDNSYHVVRLNGQITDVTLDGLTISGGNANGLAEHTSNSNSYSDKRGGAIYSDPNRSANNVDFVNCIIENNTGEECAGFYGHGRWSGNGTVHNVSFLSCRIRNNRQQKYETMFYVSSSGYQMYARGIIANCVFYGNTSDERASTLGILASTSNGGASAGLTGLIIENNTFYNNSGVNTLYTYNASTVNFRNNIVYGNTSSGSLVHTEISDMVYSYNIIEGGYTGTANADEDPMFTNAANHDFSLMNGSYAIEHGTTATAGTTVDFAGNTRVQGTRIDMGAVESNVMIPFIYVDAAATGANIGTSWDHAFTDLQDALAFHDLYADTVLVAAGTYVPSAAGNQVASFILDEKIVLLGGFNGTESSTEERDPEVNVTILSGDNSQDDNMNLDPDDATRADNAYHVVWLNGAYNAWVDGFTISHGNANGPYIHTSNANSFTHHRGGAIYVDANKNTGSAKFSRCILEENTGEQVSVLSTHLRWSGQGTNQGCDLDRCIVRNNRSKVYGAMLFSGSNGWQMTSNGRITNSLFHGNISDSLASCVTLSTSTANGGNGNSISGVEFINNTFSDNEGAYVIRAFNNSDAAVFKNNIIFGNVVSDSTITYTTTAPTFSHNILEGSMLGTNSSQADPMFVGTGDYTIQQTSPAIGFGDETALSELVDLAGIERDPGSNDIGAYIYPVPSGLFSQSTNTNIGIYPNPVSDMLNIDTEGGFELVNIAGHTVFTSENNAADISSLESGYYLLKSFNGEISGRIIKE